MPDLTTAAALDQKWHGWKLAGECNAGEPSLHVGTLPGRKRPCLYLSVSNEFCAQIVVAASFANEEMAAAVLDWLDRSMGAK